MLPPSRAQYGESPLTHPDDAIRLTDDDAAASRLSASQIGYLSDPFVSLLYKPQRSAHAGSSRKPPLINIGTHHRTHAIDLLVDRFFAHGGRQVVSLGAGSDTRFWRLMSRKTPPDLVKYVELDFPHNTSVKAQRIARSPKLTALLSPAPPIPTSTSTPPAAPSSPTPTSMSPPQPSPPKSYTISQSGTALHSPLYSLIPLDLRSSTLTQHLLPHLDVSLPTLVLAECVFCYMAPEDSRDVLRWFASRFDEVVSVVYEMCGLEDQFGMVMKRNLAARQLSLPGAAPFSNPQSQADRFLAPALGEGTAFDTSGVRTLWQVREEVIDKSELERISKLEPLDEIEELRLVLSHYIVAWGSKGPHMANVTL